MAVCDGFDLRQDAVVPDGENQTREYAVSVVSKDKAPVMQPHDFRYEIQTQPAAARAVGAWKRIEALRDFV